MMFLGEAATSLSASIRGRDVRFDTVSTDTRTLSAGALFVALRGERFDGHAYVQAAADRGAVAALVDEASELAQNPSSVSVPLLVVPDTKLALGRLAKAWRLRFAIPLITVTGSNGKTTVKEMTAAILRAHHGEDAVLATAGNFNNDIGLPLTLLRLRDTHACAVIEVGMNHPGETAYLAELARPTVALVNNAQREHQEFMKSVADVAHEHSASIAALADDGVAVFSADDDYAHVWRKVAGPRPIRDFGIDTQAAVGATYTSDGLGADMDISTPEGRAQARLETPGVHNIRNALAATAAATAAGASLTAVANGLGAFRAVKGRLQVKTAANGMRLIDDTYNANPDSVRAAIDVLAQAQGLRVLVLGDMGEVGDQGPAFHREIGDYARECGLQHLFAVGELAKEAVVGFGAGAEHFVDVAAATARVASLQTQNTTVLVKGSRFMRMERVVEQLAQ